MHILFLLLSHASSLSLERIPECKTPPKSTTTSSSIFDPVTSKIITIGGADSITGDRKPKISSFDLKTKQFEKIFKVSSYEPLTYSAHRMYLRSDRKIILFGFTPEVNSFNLETRGWKLELLTGDELQDTSSFGYTDFIFNETEYIAMFGGHSFYGYSNDLFLIDVNNLHSKKMPKDGKVPSPRSQCSLVFYNDSLYMYGYISFSNEYLNDFYRYDLISMKWEKINADGDQPRPRKFHFSYVVKDEMFVIYGVFEEYFEISDEIFKFNFLTNTWIQIKEFRGVPIAAASEVKIGEKIYLLYGRTKYEISNSIQSIDLSQDIPLVEEVTPHFPSPSSRILHFSTVINHYMYMYGGVYDDGENSLEYLTDLWRFDLEVKKWESIITSGQNPSPRKNSAFCKHGGNRIFLFGGEYEDNYYNDLYFFYTPLSVWYQVEPEGSKINERTQACLASFGNYLFIVGGKSINSANKDVWIYKLETNRLEIFQKNFTYDGLCGVKCWVEEINENEGTLVIAGGTNFFNVPNYKIFRVSINLLNLQSNIVSFKTYNDPFCVVKQYSSVVVSGDKIVAIGGYLYDTFMLYNMLVVDMVNQNCSYFPTEHELILHGLTAVHFKKNIFVFGGGGYSEIYKSKIRLYNNIYKISLTETDPIHLNCSPGTYSPNCNLCLKGTYFNNGTCAMCPRGTYNDQLGSTNIDQCIPCPYGTFSPSEGSYYCIDCFEGSECRIGSSNVKEGFKSLFNETVQPYKYKDEKYYLSNLSSSLWYGFISFFIVFLFISLVSAKTGNLVQRFDLFVQNHESELNKPIYYYKTKIGGIFSISFIIACCISVVVSFMAFNFDNIIEIRGLVPVITLEDKINANYFQANFTLFTYGGSCIVDEKCHPKIELYLDGLKYRDKTIKCLNFSGNCQVLLTLKGFELITKIAEIELQMKEPNSFASALSVNLSVSSSIPDQISSVVSSFKVPTNTEVLKGLKPSLFYYSFTPSVFTSESNKWPSKDTGFHIDTSKDIEIGSTADSQHVNIQLFLKVKIVIEESDTAMETSRILRQTWFSFISALLGSIFGLLGTFATGMGYFESCFKKIDNRQKQRTNISNYLIKNSSLRSQFNKWKSKPKDRKVIPVTSLSIPTESNPKLYH